MFRENSQIGPYTLIKKLGRGGFGEVWLAERRAKFVTTKVAVKLPLEEQVEPEAIKQEATLWEQASRHPNVLPIIDADEYDGQIVIVSEYAPDGSLSDWLKVNGKMSVEKAIETTIQILDGLEFLHSRQIIHRDIKPANILLQGSTPRLTDFGISRAMRATASSQSTNVSGTFAYMSPEGFDGKRSIQTDIWAVGVNLYQFLTGELPFPQKETSTMIAAIMMRDPEPLPANIPRSLKNVIAKALAKNAEKRYRTTKEFREDLRKINQSENTFASINSSPKNFSLSKENSTPPKNAVVKSENQQIENDTVIRSMFEFENNGKRKNDSIWAWTPMEIAVVSVLLANFIFLIIMDRLMKSPTFNNKIASTETVTSNRNSASTKQNLANTKSTNNSRVSNVAVATPAPPPFINKVQVQQAMSMYISTNFFGRERLREQNGKQRKYIYGDMDSDGDEDGVVEVSWVYGVEGDEYGISLIVFRNNGGNFQYVDDEAVGGTLTRNFNLTGIKNGKIYGNIETCRNSSVQIRLCGKQDIKKGNTQYSLQVNKLVER